MSDDSDQAPPAVDDPRPPADQPPARSYLLGFVVVAIVGVWVILRLAPVFMILAPSNLAALRENAADVAQFMTFVVGFFLGSSLGKRARLAAELNGGKVDGDPQ